MTGFGYDPSHSIVKARQEGLQAVLYKPFRADRLMDAVEQAIRTSAVEAKPAPAKAGEREAPPESRRSPAPGSDGASPSQQMAGHSPTNHTPRLDSPPSQDNHPAQELLPPPERPPSEAPVHES
jgi:hypothetical protein